MNATMIANREYVETLHAIETNVNENLVKYANKFYREKLSKKQEQDLLAMSFDDKLWLLDQYKLEVKFNKEPDLSDLY